MTAKDPDPALTRKYGIYGTFTVPDMVDSSGLGQAGVHRLTVPNYVRLNHGLTEIK